MPPGSTSRISHDGLPVWHPFTQHGLGEDIPLIARGDGVVLHGADGRQWIDAISSWWVTTHGHAHPRIMAAIRQQSEKLDQIIFAGWTHEPAEALARGLVDITPEPLTKVFFSDLAHRGRGRAQDGAGLLA